MADETGVIATKQKFNLHMDADAELALQIQQILQGIQQRMNTRIRNNADALDIEIGTGPQQWRYEGPEGGGSAVRRFIRNDVRKKVANEDAEKLKDQLGRENEIKPKTPENGQNAVDKVRDTVPIPLASRRERRENERKKQKIRDQIAALDREQDPA